MPKVDTDIETFARIKVVGVGGSGCNAVNHMIDSKVKGVEFIVMNTDTQDLHKSQATKKIHLGKNLTKGLGAGMNPDIGKRAAEETKAEIQDVLKGADMVFIACGMGGGTATGAAPIIAKCAKEQGILTVAVTTKPFSFEGQQRMRLAEIGMQELQDEVDAIVVIPNDRLLAVASKDTTFDQAFMMCDDVLRQAVEGITEIISVTGKINVDFADIKAVMQNAGSALMGIGYGSGEKRAEMAALQAINSPILDLSIAGAKGVLFAISSGDDLGILETQEAANIITEAIDKDAKVIFGKIKDERLKKGEIKITVIATGFATDNAPKKSLFPSGVQSTSAKENKENTREEIPTTKKEIHNSLPNSDYLKNKDQSAVKKEDVVNIFDEEDDDWNIPAFLRRPKK